MPPQSKKLFFRFYNSKLLGRKCYLCDALFVDSFFADNSKKAVNKKKSGNHVTQMHLSDAHSSCGKNK